MFGGGNAKYATAAGGAILGGIAGNQIDKAVNNTTGERITVRLDQKRNGTRNYTVVPGRQQEQPDPGRTARARDHRQQRFPRAGLLIGPPSLTSYIPA